MARAIPFDDEANVIVNGQQETQAATLKTDTIGGKNVTTVVLDTEKIIEGMKAKETSNTVVIPVLDGDVNAVRGELTGAMEEKNALLEVKTEKASYTLPVREIKIDELAKELGEPELKDIKISVEIPDASQEDAEAIDREVRKEGMEVVIPPVSFRVNVIYGDTEVEVGRFSHYVSRMIAVPEGVNLSRITTGVVVNKDGTLSHVPTEVTSVDGKYRVRINSLTNSTYSVVSNPKEFADVADHWAKEAVNDMGSRLVISGYDRNTFKPEQDITRAEFTAIVVRALGLRNTSIVLPFSDVRANDWYAEALRLGCEYNLIGGYEDGTFKPADNITREEAMTILNRAMALAGMNTDISRERVLELLNVYADSEDIAQWAEKPISLCIENGIVKGYEGRLASKANITRAETAVMIRRLLQKANII